jgi:hypothetical protein
MTPTEILTLTPLAALTVVFGLFPGLVLDLIHGAVTLTLADAGRQPAIEVAPGAALIAIALPILYVIARLVWVARIDLSGGGPSATADTGVVAPAEAAS